MDDAAIAAAVSPARSEPGQLWSILKDVRGSGLTSAGPQNEWAVGARGRATATAEKTGSAARPAICQRRSRTVVSCISLPSRARGEGGRTGAAPTAPATSRECLPPRVSGWLGSPGQLPAQVDRHLRAVGEAGGRTVEREVVGLVVAAPIGPEDPFLEIARR